MKNSREKKIITNHRRVKTDFPNEFENKTFKIGLRENIKRMQRRCNTQSRDLKLQRQSQGHRNNEISKPKYKNSLNLTYNKWYIEPSIRMKKSLIQSRKPNELDIQYAYNRLYEQDSLRPDCPFQTIKNSKLQLLKKIPVHNLRLLQAFKKNQQLKKKRVPKIIDLFLKKKVQKFEE